MYIPPLEHQSWQSQRVQREAFVNEICERTAVEKS